MPEIWHSNPWYGILRHYVDWCTRRSYRKLETEGGFKADGHDLILAPNHSNTLMDALVVLQSSPGPSAYGARADIFKKPSVAKVLRFLRILPIARQRDGIREVARNLEVIPEILETLHHGIPFCIFPEGRHQPKHSLLPIRKGLVRVAVQNADLGRPTYIQPVGIDYSDFFHYRGTCKLRFGEPIDVNAFIAEHKDLTKSALLWALSSEMADRIKGLILYIPDDEDYERRAAELLPRSPRRWWHIVLGAITSPLFLLSALLCLPQWAAAEFICHRRLKDPAFRNTVRFALRLVGTPLMFIIWAIIGFISLPPLAACILVVFYLFSFSFFYDWLNLLKINY